MPFHSMSYVIILHLPRLLSFRTHFFVEEKNRAIVFKQNIWLCVRALNACRAGTRTFSQCISMCAFSLSAVLCVRCLHSQQAYTHTHTHTETREFFESERHLLIVTHTHTEWMGDRERERCMLCKRCISITKLRVSAFCHTHAFMLILYSGKHNSYNERTKETKGTCERGTEILTRTQEKNYYNSARKKRSKTEDVCIRQTHTIFFSLSLVRHRCCCFQRRTYKRMNEQALVVCPLEKKEWRRVQRNSMGLLYVDDRLVGSLLFSVHTNISLSS